MQTSHCFKRRHHRQWQPACEKWLFRKIALSARPLSQCQRLPTLGTYSHSTAKVQLINIFLFSLDQWNEYQQWRIATSSSPAHNTWRGSPSIVGKNQANSTLTRTTVTPMKEVSVHLFLHTDNSTITMLLDLLLSSGRPSSSNARRMKSTNSRPQTNRCHRLSSFQVEVCPHLRWAP